MIADKPFSQACENNKSPILQQIEQIFTAPMTVWEIGSGTGQHGCFFAQNLPHIIWQPTDLLENLAGISQWVKQSSLPNINPPLVLDVREEVWPETGIEGVFTANTLHIMSWAVVSEYFEKLNVNLKVGAAVVIYGPFNFNNQYSSESNARFDQWLKLRNPRSGIRHFEDIVSLATNAGMVLMKKVAMPANNQLLVFQKQVQDYRS
ncbi:MAG: DUF938 domain-containing protein [Methylococcales bacterium]|jgi:hypothetical protein|nr:DUF938 domain-containing protein [Methylococcales bacterium]MBT3507194.1 DUF938 domain-containing protein [Methylococcales bacterium]MBT3699114.1 DUF938 domain-containing protein [Methylococcales bacterium]MBT3815370.1 DUF938 domain-containing protein [Methylococcales bacterium]MBT4032521.1 DUF938 domain-containing protein [Methylococcales bacterium]